MHLKGNVLEACKMKVELLSPLQCVLTAGSAQAQLDSTLRAACPHLLPISLRFLQLLSLPVNPYARSLSLSFPLLSSPSLPLFSTYCLNQYACTY